VGVIAEGILRGYQGLFTPVSLGYPLSVFNKNSTLKTKCMPIMRGQSLEPKFSTWLERSSPWGDLGPRPSRSSHSGFFVGCFF